MKARIRILIVDDAKGVREILKLYLRGQPAMEVAGMAQDGQEAIDMARELGPDLILMDVRMPRRDGLDATRVIKTMPAPPKVIMVSFEDDDAHRAAAAAAGADAFCSKMDAPVKLVPTILSLFPGLQDRRGGGPEAEAAPPSGR